MNPNQIKIQKGQTLGGIAKQYGTTVDNLMSLNPNLTNPNLIIAGNTLNIPGQQNTSQAPTQTTAPLSPIQNPVPATSMNPTIAPNLPTPEAPQVQEAFATSLTADVTNTRKALEDTYAKRIADLDARTKQLETQEQGILNNIESASQPFRNNIENTERERLYVNQNFEANQRTVNELESLLTQGNNLIQQAQGMPVHSSIRAANVAKAMRQVEARAGVLRAVLDARNGQISQAHTMIDRTVEAMTADRRDTLNYYSTLLELNNKNLVSLRGESRELAEREIALVENDMKQAEKSANYIKDLMINPETAQFMADAGVTLTDNIKTINQKMSKQALRNELNVLSTEVARYGATPDVINKIAQAGSKSEAIKIASKYLGEEFRLQVDMQEFSKKMQLANLSLQREKFDLEKSLVAEEQKEEFMAKKSKEIATENEAIKGLKKANDVLDNALGIEMASGIAVRGLTKALGSSFLKPWNLEKNVSASSDVVNSVAQILDSEWIKQIVDSREKGATYGSLTEAEGQRIANASTALQNAVTRNKAGQIIGFSTTPELATQYIEELRNSYQDIVDRRADEFVNSVVGKVLPPNPSIFSSQGFSY